MHKTHLYQELHQVTGDLHTVNPWIGVTRFSVIGLLLFSFVTLAWFTSHPLLFLSFSLVAGLFYAFWLICTHDMTHQTFTGWKWFDTIIPRLISWPMLWPYSLYAQLHRLHHGWNGVDLRDPERVQWTQQEYQQAHPLIQWYIRHQWIVDIFVLGGMGLIIKTFLKSWQLQTVSLKLGAARWLDITGIVVIHSSLLTLALWQGQLLRYVIFWIILERVIGLVVQTRDHLEHYGLWHQSAGYHLTQLYAGRNLKTNRLIAWLMGGLPYHAVHHAFPTIPFNRLAEAFERLEMVLEHHHLPPMTLDAGYITSTRQLSRGFALIEK